MLLVVLFCFALFVLFCFFFVLFCFVLFCFVLFCFVLFVFVLFVFVCLLLKLDLFSTGPLYWSLDSRAFLFALSFQKWQHRKASLLVRWLGCVAKVV